MKIHFAYLAVALLLITGCVQSTATTHTIENNVKVNPVQLNTSSVPPDIKLVATAIVEKLRGNQAPVPLVTFSLAGQHAIGEPGYNYTEFRLQGLSITSYIGSPTQPGRAVAKVEGVLSLRDVIDRASNLFFVAEYELSEQGINILRSATVELPPTTPLIETFYIPAAELKAARNSLTTYGDYYLFALENAAAMTNKSGNTKPIKKEYIIMAFCKDRLRPESKIEMKVTTKKNMRGTKVAKAGYINDNGWVIMVSGGKFKPGSASSKFYIGVRYQADAKAGSPAIMAASFENKIGAYKPPQKAMAIRQQPTATQLQPVSTQPQAYNSQQSQVQTYGTPAEGPLALGQRFLNLSSRQDLALIQKQLKQLRYYTHSIDGVLGPGTISALDAFAERNNFTKGQWTLRMQRVLFTGSGL